MEELQGHLPAELPPAVAQVLVRASTGEAAPRPWMIGLGKFVFGILLIPVLVHDEGRVYYQEIDLILNRETLLTVRKTPRNGKVFEPSATREARRDDDSTGMLAYRIADEIAEAYLTLIDGLDDEIDELEDHVEDWPAERVRQRISHIRHDLLHIRRTLSPTRDAIHQVVDNRVEVEGGEVFIHKVELAFGTVYDKLLRASEALDFSRDLLGGVRDYALAKIANDQNETTKRLTAFATILLLPTFIVGLYGQNFEHMPELHWQLGYGWSWALIVVSTILQLVYYRRKRWL
jgi:magnesium transporter